MADSSPMPSDGPERDDASARDAAGSDDTGAERDAGAERDLEALRRQVDEKYDFDNFGPADMAKMSLDEWEAAFDADTWITGHELLDRVEKDLNSRVATRDVFAVIERVRIGGEDCLRAYSDEGYAVVYPDGTVEGEGTVLRDVEPTVALCAMEDYDVPEPPANVHLPRPEEVAQGSGEFGNLMLQIVAAVQLLAGVGLLVAWAAGLATTIVAPVAALFFLLAGVFLFVVVANARLSDRFRSAEYRQRLRNLGIDGGERPAFLPPTDAERRSADDAHGTAVDHVASDQHVRSRGEDGADRS